MTLSLLILAAALAQGPPVPPAVRTLFQFEKALQVAVPNIAFARYIATGDFNAGVALAWVQPTLGTPAAPPSLILLRLDPAPMATPITQDHMALERRLDLAKLFSPPPAHDPLVSELNSTEAGKLLTSLLQAQTGLDLKQGKSIRLLPKSPDWRALVAGTDTVGVVRYAGSKVEVTYVCQAGQVSALATLVDDESAPPAAARFVAGERGGLVHTPTSGAVRLRLAPAWKPFGTAIDPKAGAAVEFNADQLTLPKGSPVLKLANAQDLSSDALIERLVIPPKPVRGADVPLDPLMWLLKSK